MTASCSSGSHSVPGGRLAQYVGTVDGTDAEIAIVRDASHWAAYVCGGPATLASITTWFQGATSEGDDDVMAAVDDKELDATFTEAGAEGTVTFAGNTAPFGARLVTDAGPSGLFQDASNGCRTGLIVPPADDGQPQGVYCEDATVFTGTAGRIFEQVTPVKPIVLRDGFISARVGPRGVALRLAPVVLPLDAH